MGRKSRYLGWVGSCPGGWANVRVKEGYPGGRRCVQVGGTSVPEGRRSLQERVGQLSKVGGTNVEGLGQVSEELGHLSRRLGQVSS